MGANDLLTKDFLRREYLERRKSYETIAREFGCSSSSVEYWVKKRELFGKRSHLSYRDLSGQQFGKWHVLRRADDSERGRGAGSKWHCKCVCGTQRVVRGANLRSGGSKSCGCVKERRNYRGYEKLSQSYWTRLKKGAEKRELLFTVTKKYAWDLFVQQERRCALSGIPISLSRNWDVNQTASIDRIDSDKGYVEGNIRWTHKDVNRMRWNFSDAEFLRYCKLVVGYTCQA